MATIAPSNDTLTVTMDATTDDYEDFFTAADTQALAAAVADLFEAHGVTGGSVTVSYRD